MPHLQILRQDRVVLSYLLRGPRVVLGRADTCDVALPDEAVSRTHCVLEEREGGWWVVDQSRHGTQVDGVVVAEGPLAPGSTLGLGAFEARFVEEADGRAGTVTRLARPADHEELLDVGERCAARRVVLRAVGGACEGERFELSRPRVRVGGPGAHVVLGDELPPDAVLLRVVRGRALVEPGARPAFLAGLRVREPTPIRDGETLRVGRHELEVREVVVEDEGRSRASFGELVGRSAGLQRLFTTLERVARHDATVLLWGESGTGKELAARGLHEASLRCDAPFVAVNCASVPAQLVEAELFGHEAGAFTGAQGRRDGAFQRAHKGTLFLDEIGEMAPDVQAKLLRVLESGEVQRVGGAEPEFPDVRLVAATHRNLAELVEAGRFRRDLLFRLAVLTVPLPPLRTHLEDLPELAATLLARHHPGASLTPEALGVLRGHDWPGNVRELRNVLTRAVVLHGPRVEAAHLTLDPFAAGAAPPIQRTADEAERGRLAEALRQARGNRAEAARLLGLPRTSLLYRMRKHGLEG
ncbi:MAG: sigma 54-interacting transcriptional regulator [Alphaproteobacteria bacterium]|nr:sigma 54-interacting transcriptional regulator [Alphaproteobacteria bacterium]